MPACHHFNATETMIALIRESRLIRNALFACGVIALLSLAVMARVNAVAIRQSDLTPPNRAEAVLPDPRILRLVAIGYPEALADLFWLDGLSFFAEARSSQRDVDFLRPHLRTITTLDPRFELVYEWAATLVMYGAAFTRETVATSTQILEEGVQRFPNSWELQFMLACNYLWEYPAESEEEAAEFRRRGLDAMVRASQLPGAPDWLQSATATLLRRNFRWFEAINSARTLLVTGADATIARDARFQLETLLSPALNAPDLATRQWRLWAERFSDYSIQSPQRLAIFHPDPIYLAPVADIQPVPTAQAR